MLAAKCDVCGKYYDNAKPRDPGENEKKLKEKKLKNETETVGYIRSMGFNKIKLSGSYQKYNGYTQTIDYDICPECSDKLAGLFVKPEAEEQEERKTRIANIYQKLLGVKKRNVKISCILDRGGKD